ncbi:MAG TPA: hypothetical protein DD490_32950, partial [Acidobacteria bacterium]|nr:hypothetical protein [Acidobacteriota bacterium]
NAALGELVLPGLRLVPLELPEEVAKFDLHLSLQEAGGGIAGVLSYARDLFDAPTIERLTGHLRRLLADAAANPERRLPELALLSEAERSQLLVEWNDTAFSAAETTLHG